MLTKYFHLNLNKIWNSPNNLKHENKINFLDIKILKIKTKKNLFHPIKDKMATYKTYINRM